MKSDKECRSWNSVAWGQAHGGAQLSARWLGGQAYAGCAVHAELYKLSENSIRFSKDAGGSVSLDEQMSLSGSQYRCSHTLLHVTRPLTTSGGQSAPSVVTR